MEKKNWAPKPAPLPANSNANPYQMRARGTWQTKNNVSSNLNFTEQGPQSGNVENLDSCLGAKPAELFSSRPAQLKDIQDVDILKVASPNLEQKVAS